MSISCATTLAVVGALAFVRSAAAQQVGNNTAEVHPKMTTWYCTTAEGCMAMNTSIVIDANYRWLHTVGGYDNCKTVQGGLNATLCPNAEKCAENCALEGANYTAAGVSTMSNSSYGSVTLDMYVNGHGSSPRVYLLGEDNDYQDLKLLNQELTFDVDMSKLPCGMNGALYLSEMDMNGGKSKLNPAGAAMGTGYCDAQCPVPAFINGLANTNNSGACCNEMDIWEANSEATALTPHTCTVKGVYECSGKECEDGSKGGVCDKDGCGYNAYREGAKTFYGPNGTVNTLKPFTVVTQFFVNPAADGTEVLSDIRRLYVQDGKLISNVTVKATNTTAASTSEINITDAFCGKDTMEKLGGLKAMGEALQRGMVLIFSIWNDAGQFMNWLDSGSAGPCGAKAGDPATIEKQYPDTSVTWSNVRWGDIGSTFKAK